MLENPKLSFSVPQLLRRSALDTYQGNDFLTSVSKDDLLLVKYGMLTIDYFCQAAKFPVQTREILEKKFIRKQSELVYHQETKGNLLLAVQGEQVDDKKERKETDS